MFRLAAYPRHALQCIVVQENELAVRGSAHIYLNDVITCVDRSLDRKQTVFRSILPDTAMGDDRALAFWVGHVVEIVHFWSFVVALNAPAIDLPVAVSKRCSLV